MVYRLGFLCDSRLQKDWSSSRVVASISGMLLSQVVVVRDGNSRSVPASELVPGDIIEIRAGNKVPADLRLFEVSGDLKFDRSVYTGEAKPIQGSVNFTDDNLLEVGSQVVRISNSGRARILPCRVRFVFRARASESVL
jgi:P-type E1-E2 ATPase